MSNMNFYILIFRTIFNNFAMWAGFTETVVAWESKGLSVEKNKSLARTNNSLSQKLKWHNSKVRIEFKGNC